MRNFKKFLALVLAMLMVSACAVSVSAAYADQADINATGYAEAVSVLSDLGVIKGDGTNFNPNGTLTRAEAAVIAAKLKAGADGQKIEWTSATSSFVDVDPAHWGNAYINYVSQRGIMDGIGGGKFNPDATLSLAEAIVIAVKTAGLQGEVAALNESLGTPSYWGTHWIAVAGGMRVANSMNPVYDLTAGVPLFDYNVPCSRATFAKIAHNLFTKVTAIAAGFNFEPFKATIDSVTADEVKLSNLDTPIVTSAFNAALAASGIEATAADLKDCEVYITWNTKTMQIIDIELNTTVATATYADNAIAYTKDSDGNDVKNSKIIISGVEYIIGDTDKAGTIGAIGGTATATKGVELTIDGDEIEKGGEYTIPTYYKAIGYDDDSDGDYERVVINTYVIATVELVKTTDKGVAIYKVNDDTVNEDAGDNTVPVIWTGATLVADNETPMLVAEDITTKDDAGKNYVIDVLEVAASVTGKVQGTSTSGKYLTLTDGSKYYWKNTGAEKPDTWVLQQTITFYTIGGEYVKLADATVSDFSVIIEDVVVNSEGKAAIKGYNAETYAPVEFAVDGIKAGKITAMNAYEITNEKNSDTVKYAGKVAIGELKDDGKWKDNNPKVTFEDHAVENFTKTEDGIYWTGHGTAFTDGLVSLASVVGTMNSDTAVKINNGYVYVDDIAKVYTKNVAIFKFVAAKEGDFNAYADSFAVSSSMASMTGINANCKTIVEDNKTKITFVYITAGSDVVVTETIKSIPADKALIQVISDEIEAGYDYFIYEAVDMTNNKLINVKATTELEKGEYYLATEGVTDGVAMTDKWVKVKTITVDYKGGLIPTYKANITVCKKTGDALDYVHSDEKEFGLDMMTVYLDENADGLIDKKDGAPVTKAAADVVTATLTAEAYVIEGKIILVK